MAATSVFILPSTSTIVLGIGVLLLIITFLKRQRSTLRHVRGPPTKSWLLGHEYDLNRQGEIGDLEFKWLREYGATWKIGDFLGTDGLMTADPKALHHIFQKAGTGYSKKPSQNHVGWLITGPGIIWSQGEAHTRHRKIMSPAFSNARLKSFLPLFQRISSRLAEKWKGELFNTEIVELFMDAWLSRATLDTIGEAAFDYDFRALDDAGESVLAKEYHGIFKDTGFMVPKAALVFRAMWDYLPQPVLNMFKYIPADPFTRLRRLNNVFTTYGKDILHQTLAEIDAGRSATTNDMMNVLIRANVSSDAKMRLSDEELLAEMFTLTFAGHETTATALTFLLYELARHPDYQTRLRKDIREARGRVKARGDSDFTVEDLDNIPSLVNAIKEGLRLHPGGAMVPRVATKDDVLPLAFPVVSTTGALITEILVKKGQTIIASFAAYQRLPEVWGENADAFDPDRFSRIDPTKQTSVGVYANLITFSAGPNACIGWRFSIIEQQAFIAELVDTFQFLLPEGTDADHPEVIRAPSGPAMVPMIRGKPELGSALRLRIAFAPV
ncbi:PAH-inducible cytochrome P450 monooxygenase PC-PAH 4 [Trametes meyenii]|nr:PAH-inducible cytochrome P450 monooxygenase PC-PAH 4 [Trametes meyenii]